MLFPCTAASSRFSSSSPPHSPRGRDLPEILKAAAGYDSEKSLAVMLEEDAGLAHYRDPETQWTPLHYAAMSAQADNVNLLLDHGVRVDIRREGQTPLHRAVVGRQPDVVHEGSDGNAITISMQPRRDARVAVVRLLIERGADVNATNEQGHAALAIAAGYGMPEVLAVLIESGAAVNPANVEQTGGGSRPLFHALQAEQFDNADLLLDHGAEVGAYTNAKRVDPLLSAAVRSAPVALIRRMLTAGSDPHHPAAISMAATHGRLEVVELLEARMRVGDERQAAIDHAMTSAASGRQGEVMEFLEQKGASESAKLRGLAYALQGQIWVGDTRQVEELERIGAPINAYALAALGRLDELKLLATESSAVLRVRDGPRKTTLLHAAASCGRLETLEWLLTRELDVAAATPGGYTALHLAARSGHTDVVAALLEAGADVHANLGSLYVDGRYTALSLATKHERADVVVQLLEAGARIEHEHAAFARLFVAAPIERRRAIVALLREPTSKPRLGDLVKWVHGLADENDQKAIVIDALREAGAKL